LNLPASQPRILRFGVYAIDPRKCTLQCGEDVLALRPKAFDVLCHLARNPGRVVGKRELLETVWAGHFVSDDALVQCVRDVRLALSDQDQRIVKTVPRRGYLFCAETTPEETAASEAVYPVQTIDHCRSRDGVRIAMATVGQGLPLIRPPTWFNHLEYDWHVQFRGALYRFLADRVKLIRYDGRANGLSDRYVPGISLELLECDLQAVVDALQLQRYALLGISQGAAIAIAHAVRYPERVMKLVLNGAFALGANKRGSLRDQEMAQAYITLMRHGWGDEHSSFLRAFSTLFFPGASAEEIRALAQLQRMAMSAEAAVKLRNVCADVDIMDLLPKLTVPTLVLHSTHDNAVPFDEGRRLAALIPNARFVALESQNHVPMPDEPAWPQFIAEIESFLSEPV
jgi:pimeloyl-ACP methyl ester carboxylesterase/DNA-binding winged helix-turn-helix (wHTH) protein